MENKWTTMVGLTMLAFVLVVPFAIYQPDDPGILLWLPEAVTEQARTIDTIFYFLLGLTGVLFVGIHAAMIYFMVVYRRGQQSSTSDVEGHLGIEITWTVIPTLLMIFLGVWTYQVYDGLVTPNEPNVEVEVEALQFSWRFTYPEAEEPFTTTNNVVLPEGHPVQLNMTSQDVLHSFWVPEFRMKQDVLPGTEVQMHVDSIDRTGEYSLRCAELCGIAHYDMVGTVIVIDQDEFEEWQSLPDRDQRQEFLRQVRADE